MFYSTVDIVNVRESVTLIYCILYLMTIFFVLSLFVIC